MRKARIPDSVVVPDAGDQNRTLLPPRRRPRVRKDLNAGPLEAEVASFALHMAGRYRECRCWLAECLCSSRRSIYRLSR